jgi:hypothetical protein
MPRPPAGPAPVVAAPTGASVHVVQSGVAHPQSHPILSVNAVRTFLTEIAQNLPRITSQPPMAMDPRATMASAGVQTQPFPETLAGLVQLLSQTQAVVTQVAPPIIYRLNTEIDHLTSPVPSSAAASSSTHPDTPQSRLALQSQLRQLSPGLRRIGDSLRGLATLIEAIQVHPQTGEASLLILPAHLQPGRQVNVTHAPATMQMMHVNLPGVTGMGVGGAPGQPLVMNFTSGPMRGQQMPSPHQAAQQPVQAPIPSAAATPPTTGANAAVGPAVSATPASSTAAAAPPAFNLMSLLQQVGPLVGPLVSNLQVGAGAAGAAATAAAAAVPGASAGAQASAGHQPAPNPMADIMAALGPMFAGLQAQPIGANAPQQSLASTAAASTPAQAQAQAPPSVPVDVGPVRSSAPPAGAVVAAVSESPPPPAVGPNLSSMFGSLMPMIGQMMNNPAAAGGGGSLQNIIANLMGNLGGAADGSGSSSGARSAVGSAAAARSADDDIMDVADDDHDADDDGDQPASLFDMFLSHVMQHLSLPDLMGLISGNFSGLDRVHAPFRELLMDLLAEDDSEQNRELLSHSFASGIVDSMLDQTTLAQVSSQRIDGQDPHRVSAPVVRNHVRRLLDLILDTPVVPVPPTPAPLPAPTPNSFSMLLKSWCSNFCGEWLVVLGGCYRDGLTSSQRIATTIVQQKFSSVGGGEMVRDTRQWQRHDARESDVACPVD